MTMRADYTAAYRLLRQARKHLPWLPRHLTFWGKRIIRFERQNRRTQIAMARAAESLDLVVNGGEIRHVRH